MFYKLMGKAYDFATAFRSEQQAKQTFPKRIF